MSYIDIVNREVCKRHSIIILLNSIIILLNLCLSCGEYVDAGIRNSDWQLDKRWNSGDV